MTTPAQMYMLGMSFVKTFIYGLFFIGAVVAIYYFKFFKYEIEINKNTGSGIQVIRYRARKNKDKNGNFRLDVFFSKKSYSYPADDSFIYRKGKSWVIRFYERAEGDYHPVKVMESAEGSFMKVIPQNIKYLFKADQEAIDSKYEAKKTFMQQYGQVLGLGILVIGFIIGIYFILNHVDKAIELGNTAIQLGQSCRASVVQSVPPA